MTMLAGMLALTDMTKRLHEDHENATLLAEGELPCYAPPPPPLAPLHASTTPR